MATLGPFGDPDDEIRQLAPALLRRALTVRTSGRLQRVAWGGADQALSSLTNFLLTVLVARSVGVDEFGAFSIAFATYLVFLQLSRSLTTEPLTIRYSVSSQEQWRKATRGAAGTALLLGVVAGTALAIVGLVIRGAIGDAVAVVGVTLMPLLVQDAWRFAFFAAQKGRSAFVNDLVWTIALVPAVVLIEVTGRGSTEVWLAAWAAAAAVAAVFGMWQAKVAPRPDFALAWLREHRSLTPRLVTEGLVLTGTGYITLFGVTVISGLRAVAAVRAAQVLMNAIHIATFGAQLFALPEAVAIGRRSVARLREFAAIVSGALMLLALAWGGLLLALPDSIGRAIMGDTWASAQAVLLPIVLLSVTDGARVGAFVGLRALALVKESLRARTANSLLQFGGGVLGARIADAAGAAWGMAIAGWIGSGIWWYQLFASLRRESSERAQAQIETVDPHEKALLREQEP